MLQIVYRMDYSINKEKHDIKFFNVGYFDRNEMDVDIFKAESLMSQKDLAANMKH